METIILGLYILNYGPFLGVIVGLYWDNGKENGNYYRVVGFIGFWCLKLYD